MNQDEFDAVEQRVSVTVDLSARFPTWPFPAVSGYAVLYEFDQFLSPAFGGVVDLLMGAHGDTSVSAINPEPSYIRDSYGYYPAFTLGIPAVGSRYGEAMAWEPNDDPTGALEFASNGFAVCGSTGRWAAFGQRDWEVALVVSEKPPGPWLDSEVAWFAADIDLSSIRSPAGYGMPLGAPEIAAFQRGIRSRGSGPLVSR
ncbi:hypothetical protein [Agromyces sp. Marseille-Q5079]|uniref:hypothetical protein n=1 Tax=Agromyces sp. Marseille-Q5079 TaxID=3439059 RepID=UPI003D9CA3FF